MSICSNAYNWIYIAANNRGLNLLSNYIKQVNLIIKTHYQIKCQQLIELCAIDYPNHLNRFQIVYNYLSVKFNQRLIIKTWVSDNNSLNSVTATYSSSNWLEREVYDLFGVVFNGHVDLRRILTDYGFEGYPLRKDFPFSGFNDLRFSYLSKKISKSNLYLIQQYRNSNFDHSWFPLFYK